MKRSIFSSLLKLSDRQWLAYSSYRNRYLAIPRELLPSGNLGAVREDSPLFDKLVECGVLVEDDKDEIKEFIQESRKIDDDSVFILHINPTLNCNFKCWYCYENHVAGSQMSADTQQAVVQLVRNRLTNPATKHLSLSFFGGEPLMYFDKTVCPLLIALRKEVEETGKTMSVHFTTNGYLITDAMIEFLKEFNSSFQITLDGGRENHNRTRNAGEGQSSFDTILANIRKLTAAKRQVQLRINYTADNLASVGEIIPVVASFPEESRVYLSVDFQRVWQDAEKIASEVVMDKVEKYVGEFLKIGIYSTYMPLRATYQSPCYGDKRNYVLVNFNGDIYHCTARDFRPERRSGVLQDDGTICWNGNFHEERLSMKLSKAVCRQCRIVPLCMGGCCQRNYETQDKPGCTHGYTEDDIDSLILGRFKARYMK